jgi:hypothetical protein
VHNKHARIPRVRAVFWCITGWTEAWRTQAGAYLSCLHPAGSYPAALGADHAHGLLKGKGVEEMFGLHACPLNTETAGYK